MPFPVNPPVANIAFDPAYFAQRYPEFAAIASTTAPGYFIEASCYVTNSRNLWDQNAQYMFLHMITAHIAELYDATSARGSQALVGRISDASEGTVKVTAAMSATPGTADWFNQTKYGASFWQAISRYRHARYVAPRRGGW